MVDTRTSGRIKTRKLANKLPVTTVSTKRGKPISNKFNVMSSPSYWLSQIKQSEAAGKHQVSLGFFKLALEAGCKNVEPLRNGLESYCIRHNLVEVGESSCSKRVKKLFQRYNIRPKVQLPFDMQVEIMKRLPIKSLIRFRLVSKQWKSFISSSEFVVDYSLSHTQSQKHLLVRYLDPEDDDVPKYVSIVDDDDDTFPDLKCFLTVPMPVSTKPIVTCSQGLFCFRQPYEPESNTVVLWNPTIRKSVSVDVPNMLGDPFITVVGFGVCPSTSDPMLVKISFDDDLWKKHEHDTLVWQVEVFKLSSGLWRTPLCSNMPRTSIILYPYEDQRHEIAIDGCIYWLGYLKANYHLLIMSFDMTSETFTEVDLPDSLELYQPKLSKLRESLCVIEKKVEERFELWIMREHGVQKLFTKLYNIDFAGTVLGFRNNGEPIVIMDDNAIYTYESNEEEFSYIGIYGDEKSPLASSYMETLLLLDQ